jgi:glycine/D-amino acid oxidase-like deaminating enzyme
VGMATTYSALEQSCGAACRLLSKTELGSMEPHMRLAETDSVAFFHPEAGLVRVWDAVHALIQSIESLGGTSSIHSGAPRRLPVWHFGTP